MKIHEVTCLVCQTPISEQVKVAAESRGTSARFCGPAHRRSWNVRNSRLRARENRSASEAGAAISPARGDQAKIGGVLDELKDSSRAETAATLARPTEVEQMLMPESPFAKYPGILRLRDAEVDCYVLDTKERVISQRAVLNAITGVRTGNFAEYIGIQALKPYLDNDAFIAKIIEFSIPGNPIKARGVTAENFLILCEAYVRALADGQLSTDRQRQIAATCSLLTSACAKVGLIALIDEATGYQYERAEDALEIKLRAYVSEELRAWEKTFPDDLWEQFGRLTNWKGSLHSRPRWWGHLVNELIYDALDPDIATHLRTTKPPPRKGQNYHSWMTADIGLKALLSHIYEIIGIAKTCSTVSELKSKVGNLYSGKSIQISLYLPPIETKSKRSPRRTMVKALAKTDSLNVLLTNESS